jgi:hypothetical protein
MRQTREDYIWLLEVGCIKEPHFELGKMCIARWNFPFTDVITDKHSVHADDRITLKFFQILMIAHIQQLFSPSNGDKRNMQQTAQE